MRYARLEQTPAGLGAAGIDRLPPRRTERRRFAPPGGLRRRLERAVRSVSDTIVEGTEQGWAALSPAAQADP